MTQEDLQKVLKKIDAALGSVKSAENLDRSKAPDVFDKLTQIKIDLFAVRDAVINRMVRDDLPPLPKGYE